MTKTLKELLAKSTPRPYRVVNSGSAKYIGSNNGLIADMCRDKCEDEAQTNECDCNAALLAHSANVIEELVEAANHANCSCSPKERDSGHKSGCWMPILEAALARAETVQL